MPLTTCCDTALSAEWMASEADSTTDFWKRAEVPKRRALRAMVVRNIVAGGYVEFWKAVWYCFVRIEMIDGSCNKNEVKEEEPHSASLK